MMQSVGGVESTTQCYLKCKAQPNYECVAFAYTLANSHCGLYKGGPYTSGDNDPRSTCYTVPAGMVYLV